MHNLDYCNVACSIADKMGTVKSKGHDLSSWSLGYLWNPLFPIFFFQMSFKEVRTLAYGKGTKKQNLTRQVYIAHHVYIEHYLQPTAGPVYHWMVKSAWTQRKLDHWWGSESLKNHNHNNLLLGINGIN